MKKAILLLAVFLCGVAYAQKPIEKSRQDIQIIDILTPGSPDQMRSLLPCATAWLDYDSESIEVEVNIMVGCVDIVIANIYGQTIFATTIDTDATAYITLPMPVQGMYRLTISGPEYRGEGEFLIEE